MRRYIFLVLVTFLVFHLSGCGKKKETLQEFQEPLSIELSPALTTSMPAGQQVPFEPQMTTSQVTSTAEIPLPPQGPYKPTNQEIQTALKNSGYYTGEIDGKVGPLSKKAIKDFQAANNLEADGKVGLKTWAVLSPYLNPEPTPVITPAPKKKKR